MHSLILVVFMVVAAPAAAQTLAPRTGWAVLETEKSYDELVDAVKDAIVENGLGVVTEAGPTEAARARGIEIPGNRVIGAFSNEAAVDMLALSEPAMIEAPIRFYVTENMDGTASLSYKTPSFVFEPYVDEAGPDLAAIADDLDTTFATIAQEAAE